tara:strand:+ start:1562 stop:1684 length:123 start_codon:yes stop_codon:yes gene_type:complete
MIEIIATYFEFFPGDFIVFGLIGTIFYIKTAKEDDEFFDR